MAKYPNFYENLKEAHHRLLRTTVVYDDTPYSVVAITDHKKDNIFRVYLMPMEKTHHTINLWDYLRAANPDNHNLGPYIDKWMDENPSEGVLRKHMNSPLFNKFRPFPLGMCNANGSVLFLERQPVRQKEQGLTPGMILETKVQVNKPLFSKYGSSPNSGLHNISINSKEFVSCVRGEYPSPMECLAGLKDPEVTNDGVAFDRNFAFLRGPIDTMFLAYKADVVGHMPHGDVSEVRLSKEHKYTKEVVEALNLFENINVM